MGIFGRNNTRKRYRYRSGKKRRKQKVTFFFNKIAPDGEEEICSLPVRIRTDDTYDKAVEKAERRIRRLCKREGLTFEDIRLTKEPSPKTDPIPA
ncbi:hypothetical protein ACFL24_01750 [Patescibacteria group bacterium]